MIKSVGLIDYDALVQHRYIAPNYDLAPLSAAAPQAVSDSTRTRRAARAAKRFIEILLI